MSAQKSKKILHFLDLLFVMSKNEIKSKYKNSILGILWIILNPIIQMGIIGIVFGRFIDLSYDNYFLYIYTGLLPWNYLSQTLSRATTSIVDARNLIKKAKFSQETIPLSIVGANFFNLCLSSLLLIVYLIFIGKFNSIRFLLFFPAVLWLFLIVSGISLLTAALHTKYRDVNFMIQALIIVWFYATPVIYTFQMVPQEWIPIFSFNPIIYPLELYRASFASFFLPSTSLFVANLILLFVIVSLGIFVFRKMKKTFSDWV